MRDRGVRVFDLADPTTPELIASIEPPVGDALALWVETRGDTAFVAFGKAGLIAYDLSDPEDPTMLGRGDRSGTHRYITLAGDLALATVASSDVALFDISDPQDIVLRGGYSFVGPYTLGHVGVEGDQAWVPAGGLGLVELDISDPGNPVAVDTLALGEDLTDVVPFGEFLYAADAGRGVHTVRMVGLEPVRELATVGTPVELNILEGMLVASLREDGVLVLDLRNPQAPLPVIRYDTCCVVFDFAWQDDVLYTADDFELGAARFTLDPSR
jgi:hypothetical protein